MFCSSCGFKNPDEARFCMKCGAATMARVPVSAPAEKPAPAAAATKPVSSAQPPKNNPAGKPAIQNQQTRASFDLDNTVGAIAVGVGSLVVAYILAHIGYHAMEASTAATVAGDQSASYGSGYYSWFLAAFAVASGGLRMASRIGKK